MKVILHQNARKKDVIQNGRCVAVIPVRYLTDREDAPIVAREVLQKGHMVVASYNLGGGMTPEEIIVFPKSN